MIEKNKKLGAVALIFAILALSQGQAISTFSINLLAGNGINISQIGDNYTISATGNGSAGSDHTKLNKSGDTISGNLIIIKNITADSYISSPEREFPLFWDGNTAIEMENTSAVGMRSVSATTTFFGANRVGSNLSNPAALPANGQIFNFFGAGFDGVSWAGTSVAIQMWGGASTWTATSHPTKLKFKTTDNNSIIAKDYLSIDEGVILNQNTGSGNANLLIDSIGKIYTNRSNGAGIPISSQNGTQYCIFVSNLGVLSAVAGNCA